MKFLESHWQEPDEGIWEVRGGRKNFTHSKMMAWLAFHRGVQLIEEAGLRADGELERWKKVPRQIHREVCERGYNPKVKAFTQYYGSDALDASLLMMPMVGFSDRRRACAQYHCCDRAGSAGARLRAALPTGGGKCGWFAWRSKACFCRARSGSPFV
jgi:hypothetical protein